MKQARILVVDDYELLALAVAERLQLRHYETVVATSGAEGIRLALEDDFDVIVSDVAMPGVDGEEFLAKLKDAKVRTRFIFMTGASTDLQDTVRFVKSGACDVIHKPFELRELVLAVDRALALESPLALAAGKPSQLTKNLLDKADYIEREAATLRREKARLEELKREMRLQSILTRLIFLSASIFTTVLFYRLRIASGEVPVYLLPIVLFLLLSLPFDRIRTFVAKMRNAQGRATFK